MQRTGTHTPLDWHQRAIHAPQTGQGMDALRHYRRLLAPENLVFWRRCQVLYRYTRQSAGRLARQAPSAGIGKKNAMGLRIDHKNGLLQTVKNGS